MHPAGGWVGHVRMRLPAKAYRVINGLDRGRLANGREIAGETGFRSSRCRRCRNTGSPRRFVAACPDPDILVNNNAGPPLRDFRELSIEDMAKGVNANMLTPIALIQGVIDGMRARKFGRIINITSSSVIMPLAGP